MKAHLLYDGSIAMTGKQSTLIFTRVCAGVGWPESEQGALCVLAESMDGVYHAMAEWRGSLYELGTAAVNACKDLLVDIFWIDASDEVSTLYFRHLDFSLGKIHHAKSPRRSTRLHHAESTKTINAVEGPSIVGVKASFRENFRASLETVRGIAASQRLAVHRECCPTLYSAMNRDLDYLLTSPVVRALVWAITAMEATREQAGVNTGSDNVWYHNLRK